LIFASGKNFFNTETQSYRVTQRSVYNLNFLSKSHPDTPEFTERSEWGLIIEYCVMYLESLNTSSKPNNNTAVSSINLLSAMMYYV